MCGVYSFVIIMCTHCHEVKLSLVMYAVYSSLNMSNVDDLKFFSAFTDECCHLFACCSNMGFFMSKRLVCVLYYPILSFSQN